MKRSLDDLSDQELTSTIYMYWEVTYPFIPCLNSYINYYVSHLPTTPSTTHGSTEKIMLPMKISITVVRITFIYTFSLSQQREVCVIVSFKHWRIMYVCPYVRPTTIWNHHEEFDTIPWYREGWGWGNILRYSYYIPFFIPYSNIKCK